MTKEDGGPAFPVQTLESEYGDGQYHDVWRPVGGMTLRDYFAGQALTGWLAMHADHESSAPTAEHTASVAYKFADAMIEARTK